MQYDYLIVGAGLFGAVFAQQAREAGRSVLLLEARDHIGGNCHSSVQEGTDIIVHDYGTHIFHTNDEAVWRYLNRFTAFNSYKHRVLTTHQGRVYSMPINLGTINAYYGTNLRPSEVAAFIDAKRERIARPQNLEEQAISLIGPDLYEAFIKGYTKKQWGCDPKELPASIIKRLPVRSSYEDGYFNDRYQGIPVEGYTPIFERLLADVDVELEVDFLADRDYWRGKARQLVYTGPIDRYYDYQHGRLHWRSVRFETEVLGEEDHQGTSVMNFADESVPYTRIHEPKHLHPEKTHRSGNTVIVREFSQVDDDRPYYPVNFAEDKAVLERYRALQKRDGDVLFGGRLASYMYYDMHQVVAQALTLARRTLPG